MNTSTTPFWKTGFALITIAMLATACGPDDENNKTTEDMSPVVTDDMGDDMTPVVEDDMGDDMTPVVEDDMGDDMTEDDMGDDMTVEDMGDDMTEDDMGGDMTEDDMGDDMGGNGDTVAEVEPNGDPEVDTLVSFTPGDTITGNIAAYDGTNDIDADFFRVSLTAGDVFEWSISELGTGFDSTGIGTILISETGDIYIERYLFSDDPVSTRQVFIPETGDYLLYFFDVAASAEEPAAHGGDDSTYEISTGLGSLNPSAVTVPASETGDLADGNVDSFSFTWASDQVMFAQVFGSREPVSSDLDPVLFAWDVADSQLVAFNDDLDANNGEYDSELLTQLENGKDYYLILDGWAIGAGTEYQLDVAASSRDADSGDNPISLAIGDELANDIGEADATNDYTDTDYFEVNLQPGETVKIEVEAAGMMDPRVDVLVDTGFFGFQVLATGVGVEGLAGVTFDNPATATDAAQFFVLVNDAANIPADDTDTPDYVGGAGYDYTIKLNNVTLSPVAQTLPFNVMGSYPAPGDFMLYDVAVEEESLIQMSATSASAEPLVVLFADDGIVADEAMTYKPGSTGTRTIGTRDISFRGANGATTFDFDMTAEVYSYAGLTLNAAVETGSNTDAASAQALTLPAQITGLTEVAVDGDPADYFSFTASAGDKIAILTQPDPNAPDIDPNDPTQGKDDADTVISVIDGQGMIIAENDDMTTDVYSTFSALVVEIPADGTYTIEVAPYASGDDANGHYILTVFQ